MQNLLSLMFFDVGVEFIYRLRGQADHGFEVHLVLLSLTELTFSLLNSVLMM